MDFSESRELTMLRETVTEFAEREILPIVDELNAPEGEFPYHLIRRFGELGLIGLTAPEKYGGNGLGHLARMIAIEEVAYHFPSLGGHLRGVNIVPFLIQRYGTEHQKEKFLYDLIAGKIQSSLAITEQHGGSDVTGIQTTAERDGDSYIINGRKVMISRGSVSDLLAITAKVDGKVTSFLVEKDSPGMIVGRRETIATSRKCSSPIDEIIFDNCRIPAENMVGSEGRGLGPTLSTIGVVGRGGGAAVCRGIARWAFDAGLKYAKERYLYGKPLSSQQSIQFTVAEMNSLVEMSKWLNYNFAWQLDQGKRPVELAREGAMAKLKSSEAAVQVTLKAIEIHGGYGTTKEYGLMDRLHAGLDMVAAAGSDNVMRLNIARSVIGGDS